MPRPCTICGSADRDAIDLALAGGEPLAKVAAKYRVSADAVSRHSAAHVRPGAARVQAVVREQAVHQEQRDINVLTELRRAFDRINLLFDACDRWLRDPDNPEQYDVGPRADDVFVIYREPGPNGTPLQRKARLSRLLAKLEDAGVAVDRGEVKHADIRELVLKTAANLQGQLELIAKLVGQLDERPQVNLFQSTEWILLSTRLDEALAPYPEARVSAAAALMASRNGHAGR